MTIIIPLRRIWICFSNFDRLMAVRWICRTPAKTTQSATAAVTSVYRPAIGCQSSSTEGQRSQWNYHRRNTPDYWLACAVSTPETVTMTTRRGTELTSVKCRKRERRLETRTSYRILNLTTQGLYSNSAYLLSIEGTRNYSSLLLTDWQFCIVFLGES